MQIIEFHIASCSANDRALVAGILDAASSKFDLFDNTIDSNELDTIRSFGEAPYFGFALGARQIGQTIAVGFNPKGRQGEKFSSVFRWITAELSHKFGARMEEAKPGGHIPLRRPTTLPKEGAERYKAYLASKRDKNSQKT